MKKNKQLSKHGNAQDLKSREKENARESFLGAAVLGLRQERELSGAELCRRAGDLDPRTLTAVEKNRIKNPSIETLQAIAKGFGISVSELFRKAECMDAAYFRIGNQKGIYRMDFLGKKAQLISFTPLAEEFFCGKIILEIDGSFDDSLLSHRGAFFMMVLIGQVEGEAEGKKILLKEGENLFLRGGIRFRFKNLVQRNTSLLLVTVPSCVSSGASYLSPSRQVSGAI